MHEDKYTTHIVSDAKLKLVDHVIFLGQVSISAGNRLYDRLHESVHSLDFNPKGYPRYLSRKKTKDTLHYRLCDKQRYRIVFKVTDDAVHIHDVQDCRQHQSKSIV